MDERKTIEDKLRKKEHEIHVLDERLKVARIYAQALQDVLKSLDRKFAGSTNGSMSLKAGSAVKKARDIILHYGDPTHINTILEAMGKDTDRDSRSSLTSSLSAYVRKGEIFTRTAPNTFGLLELGHETSDEADSEPPSDFGEMELPRGAPVPPPRRAPSPSSLPAEQNDEIDDDIPF